MKSIRGDIVELALAKHFDVIVHGCNCQCVMGKGVALAIKTAFPEAYTADLATLKGDRSKLGSLTAATVSRDGHTITVVNGYTQYHWRGKGVLADYEAIRSVMRRVKREYSGKRIGYPRIGAGLAGGDWIGISGIIEEELAGEDHTLVEYAASQFAGADG